MANATVTNLNRLTAGANSAAFVASGVAIVAMAIESLPLLAVAGVAVVLSGALALSAGSPKEATPAPKVEPSTAADGKQ
ncbi:MAG: hypothetical protein IVW54_16070 [Candidatus Binataceae bacterium]|nr:hypothetical protein [Candidatus Binataceae bacterium]